MPRSPDEPEQAGAGPVVTPVPVLDAEGARAVLRAARRIAVVGASPYPWRASNVVMAYLLEQDYECVPVNPEAASVLGQPCFPTLEAAVAAGDGRPFDIVDVFRRAEHAPDIARSAGVDDGGAGHGGGGCDARREAIHLDGGIAHGAAVVDGHVHELVEPGGPGSRAEPDDAWRRLVMAMVRTPASLAARAISRLTALLPELDAMSSTSPGAMAWSAASAAASPGSRSRAVLSAVLP